MIRCGTSVNAPAITSAPIKRLVIAIPWAGTACLRAFRMAYGSVIRTTNDSGGSD
jgi:hypothetical protein